MGGGDLNLKKSWHPSTLKNIERVWKAEQKHTAEQKKIEQLQKELHDERGREEMRQFAENKGVIEKKSSRLDWMYAGPATMVERDEYLLGRQVDKTFEVMNAHAQGLMEKSDNGNQPGAIFNESRTNISVDLASKVQQDPLFVIKKREQQAKKEILMNPVKMKQLQQYLEKTVKKSRKKKSKKKKSKRSRHSSSDSDTSSGDETHGTAHSHDSRKGSKAKDSSRHRQKSRSKHLEQNTLPRDDSLEKDTSHRAKNKRGHRDISKGTTSSENEDILPKKYGLIGGKQKKDDSTYDKVDYRKLKVEKPKVYKPQPRRKLSEKEIEDRRKEMMDNAKWRDDQRTKNVQQYREEVAKETENHLHSKGARFIAPMLSKIAESGSVEARIKSNKYNIQRSGTDLNKNFAKRTSF